MFYIASIVLIVICIIIELWPDRKEAISEPCIHGHESWDDCPDCCH